MEVYSLRGCQLRPRGHCHCYALVTTLLFVASLLAPCSALRPREPLFDVTTRGSGARAGVEKLRSPTDIFPQYIGSLLPGQQLTWTAACFNNNSVKMSITPYVAPNGTATRENGRYRDNSEMGGIELKLLVGSPRSLVCNGDVYIFGDPFRVSVNWFYFRGQHTVQLPWVDAMEERYVSKQGISIFVLPKGLVGTLKGLWEVLPMLSNTWVGEAAQVSFLKSRMNAEFVQREKPWVQDLTASMMSSIQSGDFIVQSKVRGPWGAFETIQKWASGSWSGHTSVFMRDDVSGELFVAESGHYNEQGEPIIAVIPFDEYYLFSASDPDQPHLAVLPLHSSLRAKFNNTAAWEFVREMQGKKFGYHNIIFSWIDTPDQNFPPPLDPEVVAAISSTWVKLQPGYTESIWKEALNKRLNTKDLEFASILSECAERGITFGELLSIPEMDDWEYSDGTSTSCVAFVVSIWKRAGILEPYTQSIQATEFTIRDAYNMQVFEDDPDKLPGWCRRPEVDTPPTYCQILGKWRFDLPGFNSQPPYPHMNEHCPSMPPDYWRPSDC